MSGLHIALVILAALWAVLLFFWVRDTGLVRGGLASICRILWVLPIMLGLFPRNVSELLPNSLKLNPINILVDDSESMQRKTGSSGQTFLASAQHVVTEMEENCQRLGCSIKKTLLSQENALTKKSYSPLREALQSWFYKGSTEPWVVITDGGEYQPTEEWPVTFKQAGFDRSKNRIRGLIVSAADIEPHNTWIDMVKMPPLAFEDQPLAGDIRIRKSPDTNDVTVQIQAALGDTVLASSNITIPAQQTEGSATLTLPPLKRGQHLISIKVLAEARETILWDNEVWQQVEVMPNTIGILHLLGSPSWDGRFLRRSLKAEPKYDLISFFILRDPWDSQDVRERELSLIPFPVARLFTEELANFRVIILQNFNLLQFLLPEYQENLVRFVREGGGLFFIGGNRALKNSDIKNSPLRTILPFTLHDPLPMMSQQPFMENEMDAPVSKTGAWFDANLTFKIKIASPTPEKRALANVLDAWEPLSDSLAKLAHGSGLHHLENVEFNEDLYTPLLTAEGNTGTKLPLAIASYPGKGRAIWLFTDSLWKLALNTNGETSRDTYHQFIEGALTWLLRRDLRKPLVARQLNLHQASSGSINWEVVLQGPATRYFDTSKSWTLRLCGQTVENDSVLIEKIGATEWLLRGNLGLELNGGELCTFELEGEHQALGSVSAAITSVFPRTYTDAEVPSSQFKLEQLAALTGAKLVSLGVPAPKPESLREINAWLETASGSEGVALPTRYRSTREFYWILDSLWFWLLLLFLPLEVIIRRWDKLLIR